jgi:hypothetical protein
LRIVVTVVPERHCRPLKARRMAADSRRPDAGSYGESVPTLTPVLMGSPYPPSRDNSSKNTASAADTDGVGAAAAATGAPGLTAGEASQGAASTEGEAMTFLPTLPPPRRPRQGSPRGPAGPRGPSTGPEPARPKARWSIRDYQPAPYRKPWESRGGAGEAAAAVQAPPTPPERDRPPGATAGSQGDADGADLAAIVERKRRELALA